MLERLDEALQHRVLRENGGGMAKYRFSHGLLRDFLYTRLPSAERARMHRAVGRALARDATVAASELAHHFFLAAPLGEEERAIEFARRAAEEIVSQLGFEAATGHYERALELSGLRARPDPEQRFELLLGLARALFLAGRIDEMFRRVEQAAAEARALGSPERLAEAALLSAQLPSFVPAPRPRMAELLREALDALGPTELAPRVQLLAALTEVTFDPADPEATRALYREALAVARRAGDPEGMISVLTAWRSRDQAPECIRERDAAADELLELGRCHGRNSAVLEGLYFRAIDLLERGAREDAAAALVQHRELADRTRDARHLVKARCAAALLVQIEGRFEDADALATDALRIGSRRPDALFEARAARGGLEIQRGFMQGRFDEIRMHFEVPARGSSHTLMRSTLAHFYARAGELDAARKVFEDLTRNDFEDLHEPAHLHELAEACIGLRDHRGAAILYPRLRNWEGLNLLVSFPVLFFSGTADLDLARLSWLVGERDRARAHFEEALALLRRTGAWIFLPEAQVAYGEALLATRRVADRTAARPLLEEALEVARRFGLAPTERAARELLARLRRSGASR